MRSIKSLIQELNIKEHEKEFNALSILDSNVIELLNRIKKIEVRNLQYFCRASISAALTGGNALPTGAYVPLDFTFYPQFGNMHDNGNDNDSIFIRRNGVYNIAGGVHFNANALGTFRQANLILFRNGVAAVNIAIQRVPNANTVIVLNPSAEFYCYVGDFIKLQIAHDTGGDVEISGQLNHTFLSVCERREDLNPSEYGLLNPEENMR